MIKKTFFIIFFLIIFNNSFASTKFDIIENFRKIDNLSFDFKQVIEDDTEQGKCVIQYPKKINCEYDNFKKKIIVSNGKSLVIKNRATNQYFRYPLKKTPLNILLNKKYIISEMEKLDGKVINNKYYNFVLKNSNNEINIFFDKKTYNLIGWQMEDIYQNLVVTYIFDIEINKSIKEKIFLLPQRN